MNSIENYAFQISTPLSFDESIAKATSFLKDEGFGILTEIDVTKTLKEKINVDFKPFRILGACNPAFAHRTLSAVPEISTLLPCNVVVWDEGTHRVVTAMDPMIMSKIISNPEVEEVATQVAQKLRNVLTRLEELSASSY